MEALGRARLSLDGLPAGACVRLTNDISALRGLSIGIASAAQSCLE
jgi:hypothetical protein